MSKYNLLFNVNTIHLCWQVPFINVFKIFKKKCLQGNERKKNIKIQKELLSLSNEKHKIIIIIDTKSLTIFISSQFIEKDS